MFRDELEQSGTNVNCRPFEDLSLKVDRKHSPLLRVANQGDQGSWWCRYWVMMVWKGMTRWMMTGVFGDIKVRWQGDKVANLSCQA